MTKHNNSVGGHLSLYSRQQLSVCSHVCPNPPHRLPVLDGLVWAQCPSPLSTVGCFKGHLFFSCSFHPSPPFPLICTYFEHRPGVSLFPSIFSPSCVTASPSKDGEHLGSGASKHTLPFPCQLKEKGVRTAARAPSNQFHLQGWLDLGTSPQQRSAPPPTGKGELLDQSGPLQLRRELGLPGGCFQGS